MSISSRVSKPMGRGPDTNTKRHRLKAAVGQPVQPLLNQIANQLFVDEALEKLRAVVDAAKANTKLAKGHKPRRLGQRAQLTRFPQPSCQPLAAVCSGDPCASLVAPVFSQPRQLSTQPCLPKWCSYAGCFRRFRPIVLYGGGRYLGHHAYFCAALSETFFLLIMRLVDHRARIAAWYAACPKNIQGDRLDFAIVNPGSRSRKVTRCKPFAHDRFRKKTILKASNHKVAKSVSSRSLKSLRRSANPACVRASIPMSAL